MEMLSIEKELQENSYPGRGIIIGRSKDGTKAVTAYFIMGRSENSRNRIFVEDGEGIRTQAFDPSKLVDPSLIIYAPVRVLQILVTLHISCHSSHLPFAVHKKTPSTARCLPAENVVFFLRKDSYMPPSGKSEQKDSNLRQTLVMNQLLSPTELCSNAAGLLRPGRYTIYGGK